MIDFNGRIVIGLIICVPVLLLGCLLVYEYRGKKAEKWFGYGSTLIILLTACWVLGDWCGLIGIPAAIAAVVAGIWLLNVIVNVPPKYPPAEPQERPWTQADRDAMIRNHTEPPRNRPVQQPATRRSIGAQRIERELYQAPDGSVYYREELVHVEYHEEHAGPVVYPACPRCGFEYGWDGINCRHCGLILNS
jgi:hypothetical protein